MKKIVIVSDIHANAESFQVLPDKYDELRILGDLANYGPNPVEVIDFARAKLPWAFGAIMTTPPVSERIRAAPLDSALWRMPPRSPFSQTKTNRSYEKGRYKLSEKSMASDSLSATHSRTDPLYEYCPPDRDRWRDEVSGLTAVVLLAGHTHLPFQRRVGTKLVVNPGSLGQPKHPAHTLVMQFGRAVRSVW